MPFKRITTAAFAAFIAAHTAFAADPVTVGDLTITEPAARATPPNAPVGGGFLTVTNTGQIDDRLVGAASEAAGHMEVHEMVMQGDVMKMRELAEGLPIPAGATVELRPGGYHLMFMALKHPLVEGETVDVVLTFEQAGEVPVTLEIGPRTMGAGGGMGPKVHGMAGTGN